MLLFSILHFQPHLALPSWPGFPPVEHSTRLVDLAEAVVVVMVTGFRRGLAVSGSDSLGCGGGSVLRCLVADHEEGHELTRGLRLRNPLGWHLTFGISCVSIDEYQLAPAALGSPQENLVRSALVHPPGSRCPFGRSPRSALGSPLALRPELEGCGSFRRQASVFDQAPDV